MITYHRTCTITEFIRRAKRDECWNVDQLVYDKLVDTFYLGDHVVPKPLEDEILQRLHMEAVVKTAYANNGLPSKWEAKKMAF